MDLTPQKIPNRQTSNGDGLGRGMEFAIVLFAFLGIGYALDRWLDTKPVFMIVMVVLSLVGQFASMWYSYDSRMRQLEAERREQSHGRSRDGRVRDGHARDGGPR